MPFLDWVNKTQAVNTAADVPYHLLQFQYAHGDARRQIKGPCFNFGQFQLWTGKRNIFSAVNETYF